MRPESESSDQRRRSAPRHRTRLKVERPEVFPTAPARSTTVDRLPVGRDGRRSEGGERAAKADPSANGRPQDFDRTGGESHAIESRRAVRCRPPPRSGAEGGTQTEGVDEDHSRDGGGSSDVDLQSDVPHHA